MLQPFGHVVWQITTDNPGIWPYHCHIAWHVSGGLYMNFMERPADIKKLAIPDSFATTCKDWNAYSSLNTVGQIDSGT
jgi:Multicopper oxidase